MDYIGINRYYLCLSETRVCSLNNLRCVGGTVVGRVEWMPHVARLVGRVSKHALSTSCMFTNKSLKIMTVFKK